MKSKSSQKDVNGVSWYIKILLILEITLTLNLETADASFQIFKIFHLTPKVSIGRPVKEEDGTDFGIENLKSAQLLDKNGNQLQILNFIEQNNFNDISLMSKENSEDYFDLCNRADLSSEREKRCAQIEERSQILKQSEDESNPSDNDEDDKIVSKNGKFTNNISCESCKINQNFESHHITDKDVNNFGIDPKNETFVFKIEPNGTNITGKSIEENSDDSDEENQKLFSELKNTLEMENELIELNSDTERLKPKFEVKRNLSSKPPSPSFVNKNEDFPQTDEMPVQIMNKNDRLKSKISPIDFPSLENNTDNNCICYSNPDLANYLRKLAQLLSQDEKAGCYENCDMIKILKSNFAQTKNLRIGPSSDLDQQNINLENFINSPPSYMIQTKNADEDFHKLSKNEENVKNSDILKSYDLITRDHIQELSNIEMEIIKKLNSPVDIKNKVIKIEKIPKIKKISQIIEKEHLTRNNFVQKNNSLILPLKISYPKLKNRYTSSILNETKKKIQIEDNSYAQNRIVALKKIRNKLNATDDLNANIWKIIELLDKIINKLDHMNKSPDVNIENHDIKKSYIDDDAKKSSQNVNYDRKKMKNSPTELNTNNLHSGKKKILRKIEIPENNFRNKNYENINIGPKKNTEKELNSSPVDSKIKFSNPNQNPTEFKPLPKSENNLVNVESNPTKFPSSNPPNGIDSKNKKLPESIRSNLASDIAYILHRNSTYYFQNHHPDQNKTDSQKSEFDTNSNILTIEPEKIENRSKTLELKTHTHDQTSHSAKIQKDKILVPEKFLKWKAVDGIDESKFLDKEIAENPEKPNTDKKIQADYGTKKSGKIKNDIKKSAQEENPQKSQKNKIFDHSLRNLYTQLRNVLEGKVTKPSNYNKKFELKNFTTSYDNLFTTEAGEIKNNFEKDEVLSKNLGKNDHRNISKLEDFENQKHHFEQVLDDSVVNFVINIVLQDMLKDNQKPKERELYHTKELDNKRNYNYTKDTVSSSTGFILKTEEKNTDLVNMQNNYENASKIEETFLQNMEIENLLQGNPEFLEQENDLNKNASEKYAEINLAIPKSLEDILNLDDEISIDNITKNSADTILEPNTGISKMDKTDEINAHNNNYEKEDLSISDDGFVLSNSYLNSNSPKKSNKQIIDDENKNEFEKINDQIPHPEFEKENRLGFEILSTPSEITNSDESGSKKIKPLGITITKISEQNKTNLGNLTKNAKPIGKNSLNYDDEYLDSNVRIMSKVINSFDKMINQLDKMKYKYSDAENIKNQSNQQSIDFETNISAENNPKEMEKTKFDIENVKLNNYNPQLLSEGHSNNSAEKIPGSKTKFETHQIHNLEPNEKILELDKSKSTPNITKIISDILSNASKNKIEKNSTNLSGHKTTPNPNLIPGSKTKFEIHKIHNPEPNKKILELLKSKSTPNITKLISAILSNALKNKIGKNSTNLSDHKTDQNSNSKTNVNPDYFIKKNKKYEIKVLFENIKPKLATNFESIQENSTDSSNKELTQISQSPGIQLEGIESLNYLSNDDPTLNNSKKITDFGTKNDLSHKIENETGIDKNSENLIQQIEQSNNKSESKLPNQLVRNQKINKAEKLEKIDNKIKNTFQKLEKDKNVNNHLASSKQEIEEKIKIIKQNLESKIKTLKEGSRKNSSKESIKNKIGLENNAMVSAEKKFIISDEAQMFELFKKIFKTSQNTLPINQQQTTTVDELSTSLEVTTTKEENLKNFDNFNQSELLLKKEPKIQSEYSDFETNLTTQNDTLELNWESNLDNQNLIFRKYSDMQVNEEIATLGKGVFTSTSTENIIKNNTNSQKIIESVSSNNDLSSQEFEFDETTEQINLIEETNSSPKNLDYRTSFLTTVENLIQSEDSKSLVTSDRPYYDIDIEQGLEGNDELKNLIKATNSDIKNLENYKILFPTKQNFLKSMNLEKIVISETTMNPIQETKWETVLTDIINGTVQKIKEISSNTGSLEKKFITSTENENVDINFTTARENENTRGYVPNEQNSNQEDEMLLEMKNSEENLEKKFIRTSTENENVDINFTTARENENTRGYVLNEQSSTEEDEMLLEMKNSEENLEKKFIRTSTENENVDINFTTARENENTRGYVPNEQNSTEEDEMLLEMKNSEENLEKKFIRTSTENENLDINFTTVRENENTRGFVPNKPNSTEEDEILLEMKNSENFKAKNVESDTSKTFTTIFNFGTSTPLILPENLLQDTSANKIEDTTLPTVTEITKIIKNLLTFDAPNEGNISFEQPNLENENNEFRNSEESKSSFEYTNQKIDKDLISNLQNPINFSDATNKFTSNQYDSNDENSIPKNNTNSKDLKLNADMGNNLKNSYDLPVECDSALLRWACNDFEKSISRMSSAQTTFKPDQNSPKSLNVYETLPIEKNLFVESLNPETYYSKITTNNFENNSNNQMLSIHSTPEEPKNNVTNFMPIVQGTPSSNFDPSELSIHRSTIFYPTGSNQDSNFDYTNSPLTESTTEGVPKNLVTLSDELEASNYVQKSVWIPLADQRTDMPSIIKKDEPPFFIVQKVDGLSNRKLCNDGSINCYKKICQNYLRMMKNDTKFLEEVQQLLRGEELNSVDPQHISESNKELILQDSVPKNTGNFEIKTVDKKFQPNLANSRNQESVPNIGNRGCKNNLETNLNLNDENQNPCMIQKLSQDISLDLKTIDGWNEEKIEEKYGDPVSNKDTKLNINWEDSPCLLIRGKSADNKQNKKYTVSLLETDKYLELLEIMKNHLLRDPNKLTMKDLEDSKYENSNFKNSDETDRVSPTIINHFHFVNPDILDEFFNMYGKGSHPILQNAEQENPILRTSPDLTYSFICNQPRPENSYNNYAAKPIYTPNNFLNLMMGQFIGGRNRKLAKYQNY